MKKLNKLEINPEKLMGNKELLLLRGGYDTENNCALYDCSVNSDCTVYPGDCIYCKPHPWRSNYWCVKW